MQYSTIFVDIDDTIWDTRGNSREAFKELFVNHTWGNYFKSFDEFYNIYLPSNINLWSLYAHGKISKDELIVQRFLTPLADRIGINKQDALQLNEELLDLVSMKTNLIEYAQELLHYLSSKYQLVIVSNGFKEVQYKKLRNSHIDVYFQHVILSDEAGVNKPHPEIFNIAMSKANAKENEVIMLGDSWESDIQGAYNRGIDQLWFNPDSAKSNGFSPTYTVENLKQVELIL